MTNINVENMTLYYQVDYTLTTVPDDAAYFHAQYRRSNQVKDGICTLIDNIEGKGQYVGTYLAWGVHNNGWWGEGEIKFFMDDDTKFPTINGTGTEDYFCGSYDFDTRKKNAAGVDVVDYTLTTVPDDAAYFHAQYRRSNQVKDGICTLIDNIEGKGQYVGTYLAWGVHNNGWWGEGEIKFYIDGDTKFPTINGTGTEDYFCGSYDFDTRKKNAAGVDVVDYTEFSTAYTGLHQVIDGDGHYNVMQRFGLYRWHIMDPIRFEKNLKVTIQDLGWRSGGRYLVQQSDISSVVFWYQSEPHHIFPKLPSKNELEINQITKK